MKHIAVYSTLHVTTSLEIFFKECPQILIFCVHILFYYHLSTYSSKWLKAIGSIRENKFYKVSRFTFMKCKRNCLAL